MVSYYSTKYNFDQQYNEFPHYSESYGNTVKNHIQKLHLQRNKSMIPGGF